MNEQPATTLKSKMTAHPDFPGLYDRDGFWYIRYKVAGVGVKKSFGNNRASMKKAIAYLATVHKIKEEGRGYIPKTAKEKPLSANDLKANPIVENAITVAELCDDWLAEVRSKPTQYKDQKNPPYRIGLIKAKFGSREAASIKPSEIRKWIDSLSDYAPATKNKLKATLSVVFRFAKENDKIDINPARDVKREKLAGGVIRYLTPEEEKRLRKVLQADVDASAGHPQYQKHMIHRIHELTVSLGTGLRKGEQYNLRWPDVNFKRRSITARDTKNGETRVVPMIDDVHDSLLAIKALGLTRKDRAVDQPNNAPDDVVFFIGDNKKWWASALKRAKITSYRWHDNRHTFCSRLAQSGASLKIIQEAAGHKTIQMSARYAHLHQTHLAEAMAVLNRSHHP